MDYYGNDSSSLSAGAALAVGVGATVIGLWMLITVWIVFRKAGQPGWLAIIPIANTFVMCKVGQKPGWWFVLFIIPIVNIVIAILVYDGVAKGFGKSSGFTVGLIFLPFIFFPILAFGSARYIGSYGGQQPPMQQNQYPYGPAY